MSQLTEKLKESGFKLTPQRLSIVDYMEGNRSHPTAARVYEDLKPAYPTMSMATVYNTLNMLSELGLVRKYKFYEDQVSFDPETKPHHHFCCSECHAILDIPDEGGLPTFKDFEKRTNNRVDSVSVVLTGICQDCIATT